jgi:membrane-bound inhibitor of C-type lysozyme
MRGLIAVVAMIVWYWCSFNLVLNVLVTDSSQVALRLGLWVPLWLIPTMGIFIWWCKGDTQYKRVFTLEKVFLTNGDGFGRMVECLDINERFATHDIFRITKEFFVDLEDLDEGVPTQAGVLYECRPKYVANLTTTDIHCRSDLLHVKIDKTGFVSVEYIGKDANVTNAEIVWSVSKEQKNG